MSDPNDPPPNNRRQSLIARIAGNIASGAADELGELTENTAEKIARGCVMLARKIVEEVERG